MLEVGDIVMMIKSSSLIPIGMVGKVVVPFYNDSFTGVSWQGYKKGHDCNGCCKDGTGWFVSDGVLKILKKNN